MKKVLVVIFSFLCVFSKAQVLLPVNNYGTEENRIKLREYLGLPRKDTANMGINLVTNPGADTGQIRYLKSDSSVYVHTGTKWLKVGNGGGGGIPTWQQTLNAVDGSLLTQDNTINSQTFELVFKADNGATNTYLSLLPNTGTLNTVNGDDYADVSTNRAGGVPYITIGAGNLLDGDHGTLYIDQDVFRLSRADGLFHFKNNGTTYRGQLGFDALSANRNYTFPDASGTIALTSDLSNSWGLTGNAGTTDGTNFIGTTDNIPFNIRVNNQKSGRIDHLKFNTFYGYQSGRFVTTGEQNTASGASTLQAMITGSYNTAIGYEALRVNTNSFNTAVGHSSLYNNSSGNTNTAIGYNSLLTNQSGSGNTGIGFNANMSASNLTNITTVGANSYATASNSLVLGSINGINGAITDTKVGIGVTNPSERLHIVGNLRLVNGSQSVDRFLKSDANGVATWSDLNQIKNLITDYTDIGNVGVGEDNLISYAIPAGQLSADGDYVEFTMNIIFAANANAKQVKLYYGATNFYASTSQNQNDGSMEIKGTIIRTGATSQRISFSQVNNTTLFPDYADYTTASETLVNAITLKATGEATSDNDIVQKILIVKYFPSN